jgi:hypothetical protein
LFVRLRITRVRAGRIEHGGRRKLAAPGWVIRSPPMEANRCSHRLRSARSM